MTDLILHEDKRIMAAESNSIMESIMMLAKDKDFDAGKLKVMQEMLFMKEDRDKKDAFIRDFILARSEIPKILKGTKGENKNYANLEDISCILDPIMEKYGFTLSFSTFKSEKDNHVGVSGKLLHLSGHWEESKYDSPIDAMGIKGHRNKTECQGSGSALTYGQRYLTILIWNLITVEKLKEDNNGRGFIIQKINETQAADLDSLINEVGAKRDAFMSFFKIESLSDLPAISYKKAVKLLIDKRNKGA